MPGDDRDAAPSWRDYNRGITPRSCSAPVGKRGVALYLEAIDPTSSALFD